MGLTVTGGHAQCLKARVLASELEPGAGLAQGALTSVTSFPGALMPPSGLGGRCMHLTNTCVRLCVSMVCVKKFSHGHPLSLHDGTLGDVGDGHAWLWVEVWDAGAGCPPWGCSVGCGGWRAEGRVSVSSHAPSAALILQGDSLLPTADKGRLSVQCHPQGGRGER